MRLRDVCSRDISKGQEPFPILCVNEVRRRSSSQTDNKPLVLFDKVDGTLPPSDFVYIKSCVEVKGLHIDRSMESMEVQERCFSSYISHLALGMQLRTVVHRTRMQLCSQQQKTTSLV